jgi:CBS domain-containing protein
MAIKIIGSTIIDDSRNIVNAGIATVTSVSIGNTQVVSSARQLQNIASLDATTTATIETAIQQAPNDFTSLNISGISTLQSTTLIGGGTSTGTAGQVLQVTGINSSVYIGGNLGIGTTNPTSKLQVVGDITAANILPPTDNTGVVGNTAFTWSNGQFTDLTISDTLTVRNAIDLADSDILRFGTSDDVQVFYDGTVNDLEIELEAAANQIAITDNGTYKVVIKKDGSVGIGSTIPTSKLDVVGDGRFSGVVTATTFIGALTGTATTATKLATERTFEITGDVVASAISFDGTGNVSLAATIQPNSVALGTDTTGDYVQSITGTSNQITVTSGTGEGSTPTLSLPNNLVLPQDATVTRDLQVNRNLNVTGNITIGGTTAFINVPTLTVFDPDIVLGFRTDAFGNDVSNDNTANHGGVAVASTEGTPLVNLFIAGIETNPATYKKIMWFKSGTFAGLGTDAWLINYAVGIGSTQFPNGTRLAAGSVQFTENDLAVVRNINASGVGTIPTLSGTTATYTTGNFTTGNIVTGIVTTLTSTNATLTNINSSGISTLGITTFTETVSFGTSAYFGDNDTLYFGDGNDLRIYHNGSNSFIQDLGTGGLYLAGSNVISLQSASGESKLVARTDGAVELYFDNVKEFETTGYGATVFGILQTQGLQINSGVSTLGITTATNLTTQNIDNSGITTTNSLSIGATQVISSARQLQNIASLDATTTATIQSAIANATNTFTDLNVTGISTLGVTSATNLTAQQLNVSGLSTFSNTLRVIPTSTGIAGIFSGTTSGDMVRITQLGTGNALVVEDSTNPDASPFVIKGDGYGWVGIGTTNPREELHLQSVDPIIRFTEDGATSDNGNWNVGVNNETLYFQAINDSGGGGENTFRFTRSSNQIVSFEGRNSGVSWFVINNSTQRVGIGTTNPSSPLTVIGDARVSGVVTATTFIGALTGTATTATNVIGGIGSITQLQVTGISTFTNGPVFIGAATSTGTASQRLQVTGGAYVSSNLGIGTTNPTSKLTVSGSASITGILTADQVYTSNNGGGQNVRIGDDFWLGDVNVADTTRFSGAQDSTRAFVIFGSSDAVALGRTGTGPLYYGGNFNVAGVITASSFSGNASSATYATTAGIATYASNAGIATYASNAGIATFATTAGIATFATTAGIATFATTAGIATFATTAGIATFATTSGIATFATTAGIATFATNAGIATYASNAGIATYASNAGIATYADNAGIATYASNAGIATYADNAGIATYASNAGIATYASNAGIATYASNAGIATYASNAGIATYASNAGIATYASNAGIATYASNAGIATTANNVSSSININTSGIITATSFSGSGTNLTGIVTSIVAGTNITVSGSTGQVTINSTGGGGGGSIAILDNTSTNDTFYVGIASTTTGDLATLNVSSTKLTFNPSTGNLVAGGTVTANSDEKLKENIKTIENALEKVLSLRGVEYDRIDTGDHQIGVIAQEVERIIPDVVYGDETKSVAYGNIVGLLIEAIKDQNKRIEELERRLEGN